MKTIAFFVGLVIVGSSGSLVGQSNDQVKAGAILMARASEAGRAI
jgi:hypothetical protein